jgi:hypothetical protein
MKGRGQKGHYQ